MRTYFFVTVGNLRGRCRRCGEAAESEPPSYSVSFFDTLMFPAVRRGTPHVQSFPSASRSRTSRRSLQQAVYSPAISSVGGSISGTITVVMPAATPARTPL